MECSDPQRVRLERTSHYHLSMYLAETPNTGGENRGCCYSEKSLTLTGLLSVGLYALGVARARFLFEARSSSSSQ